jgi:hypothetical protein
MDRSTGSPVTLTADHGRVRGRLQHTAFALLDVAPTQAPRIRLVASFPRHTASAVALVCRVGDPLGGTSTAVLTRLPKGGTGTATLDDPGRCNRITAVLVNADPRTNGHFSEARQDWVWLKDDQPVEAHVSTDFTPPAVRRRSPGPNAHGVSTRLRVTVELSEPIAGADARTVILIGPDGHRVRATVRRHGARITIIPSGVLHPGAHYTVRLSGSIEDRGGNPLPASVREWTFSTRR